MLGARSRHPDTSRSLMDGHAIRISRSRFGVRPTHPDMSNVVRLLGIRSVALRLGGVGGDDGGRPGARGVDEIQQERSLCAMRRTVLPEGAGTMK